MHSALIYFWNHQTLESLHVTVCFHPFVGMEAQLNVKPPNKKNTGSLGEEIHLL